MTTPHRIALLGLLVSFAAPATASAPVPTLCKKGEQILFSCKTSKGKVLSLCGSSDLARDKGFLEYRFGTAKKTELTYPADRARSREAFQWRFLRHAQSASYAVLFTNGGFTYDLFDQDTMGTENANGAGVLVTRPKADGTTQHVATIQCEGERTLGLVDLKSVLPAHPDSQPEE